MLTFSLINAVSYAESLRLLREHLGTNRAGHVDITIEAYDGETERLQVRMNRHNLYLDGFRQLPDGTWYHFKDATPWIGAVALPFGGRHADLGTTEGKTKFNGAAKFKVEQIKNYGGSQADTLRLGLGFLVIVICEAARFPAVEKNVANCVAGIATYMPAKDHTAYMKNWQAKTSSASSDVAVPYLK